MTYRTEQKERHEFLDTLSWTEKRMCPFRKDNVNLVRKGGEISGITERYKNTD